MTRAIWAVIMLALALPATTVAQAPATNAPPGNSAIDEYLETVPGASGANRPRAPSQTGGGSVLTPTQRAELERHGPDGRALADAVDATAPAGPAARAPAADEVETAEAEGRSPGSGVLDAVAGEDGDGGMGFILPALLVAALLGTITVTLLRRRASS